MVQLAVREDRVSDIQKTGDIWRREAVAFCPRCKAFETVWLNGNSLMPTRKFYQIGSRVYHDCGSSQACRLYRDS